MSEKENKGFPFDFKKEVNSTFRSIESFHNERAYRIIENEYPINGSIANITKDNDGGFICKIFLEDLHDYTYNQNIERFGVFEPIVFECTSSKYFAPKYSASRVSNTLTSPQVLTLYLNSFQFGLDNEFDKKRHRLVIPVEKEPNFEIIEFNSVKINGGVAFYGLVQLEINGKNFHMFKYKNDDTGRVFLIIDSLDCLEFSDFKKNSGAIITAFGYLSGNLYLDEYYYLTLDDELISSDNILYEKKEKSALTGYSLLEPFRFLEYIKAIGKEEYSHKKYPNMSKETFSNLCEIVKTNETYSRCCQLIIEGNQSKQQLLKAGIYSIALETLTNIIYEENKDRINPIEDKNLAKKIRVKLKEVISEYDTFISDYGFKILESKINDINKPTNSKKLSVPFEIYNLKLSKDDLDMLNHRNKFLHGTSPFSEEDLKNKTTELDVIIARLHFMLNSLMLKYVDYSGHIINYSGWIQYERKQKITQHLFRMI